MYFTLRRRNGALPLAEPIPPQTEGNTLPEAETLLQADATLPVQRNSFTQRKILQRLDLVDKDHISSKLQPYPRFGPLYPKEEPVFERMKDDIWTHVLQKSEVEMDKTREEYFSAVGRIEQEARNSYGPADLIDELMRRSEFIEKIIVDGCFFLHLAFFLLGASEQLGYDEKHWFVDSTTGERRGDLRLWIEAMLIVGNQIPAIVLRELMRQSFFKGVLDAKKGKWKKPRGLLRRGLYELLGLPNGANNKISYGDLLHCLQCLVLGSEPAADLESNIGDPDISSSADQNIVIVVEQQRFLSATEMEQAGIGLMKRAAGGTRGIKFSRNIFWGSLHLPVLEVDEDTEVVFRSLIEYEAALKIKLEVSSYMRLLKDVARGPADIKQLGESGIVKPDKLRHMEMLPGILNRLDCRNLTPELDSVRLLTSNYTKPAAWKKLLEMFFIFVAALTVVQTVYAILSYHLPPGGDDKAPPSPRT